MIGSLGGSVERIMFFDSCNWDFMLIVNGEEDMIFAMGSAAGASGTFERFDVLPARSPGRRWTPSCSASTTGRRPEVELSNGSNAFNPGTSEAYAVGMSAAGHLLVPNAAGRSR